MTASNREQFSVLCQELYYSRSNMCTAVTKMAAIIQEERYLSRIETQGELLRVQMKETKLDKEIKGRLAGKGKG